MLPESATNLLKSTKFLHLGTSYNDKPHVSLMNYTFYQKDGTEYIIITTPKNSTKYENLKQNNQVSILVHDWISAKSEDDETPKRRNSLLEFITNLNKAEISSVSVMIDGVAEIVPVEDSRHHFFKSLHLNNENIDSQQIDNYVKTDMNELVLIKVGGCKITDTDGNVEQY